MRKLLFLLLTIISCAPLHSQDADDKIVMALNNADWWALDSICSSAPKGSISEFPELFCHGMLGHRWNRPHESVAAFEELLANHSEKLNENQMVSVAIMCAVDLNRIGKNSEAAALLMSVKEGMAEKGNPGAIKILDQYILQYTFLSQYNPYSIKIEGDEGCVLFKTIPIGKPEKEGVHILLEESFINGISADITFDTGAAVNVISNSLIERYNLITSDVETKVKGTKSRKGSFAIVKELRIGNITVRDVPFYILDISSDNEEADQYMKSLNVILGSDLMLRLKDITIDFEHSRLLIPSEIPLKTAAKPNLCFSSAMNLHARGSIHGNNLLMNIDTGDCSYGSLGKKFYKENKKYITSEGTEVKIRKAGIGGVEISKGYEVPGMELSLGGNTVDIPKMEINVKGEATDGSDCNLGLKSLMLYRSIRFNLVDFLLSTEKY